MDLFHIQFFRRKRNSGHSREYRQEVVIIKLLVGATEILCWFHWGDELRSVRHRGGIEFKFYLEFVFAFGSVNHPEDKVVVVSTTSFRYTGHLIQWCVDIRIIHYSLDVVVNTFPQRHPFRRLLVHFYGHASVDNHLDNGFSLFVHVIILGSVRQDKRLDVLSEMVYFNTYTVYIYIVVVQTRITTKRRQG